MSSTSKPLATSRRSHKRKADSTRKRSVKRQTKAPATAPTRQDIGQQLRKVVARLERIEAYLIVAGTALEQCPDYSSYIRVLLRIGVGNLLFKQVRALEDLAAQCDGGPASERDHEDDPDEDEDTDARGDE
jgi:hypothetical protein